MGRKVFISPGEDFMKVKNLNVTSDKKCVPCGGWLKHWENLSEETAGYCQASGCTKEAEVGAHIKKVGGTDHKHYIVPLCKGCNGKSEEFELEPYATLVSADPC